MLHARAAPVFPLPPDLDGYWEWDALGAPRPQPPLEEELRFGALQEGFRRAMAAFGGPVHLVYRAINRYMYTTVRPLDLDGESPGEQAARYEAVLDEVVPRIGHLWETEWLPAILPGLARARTLDYAALADDALLATLDELREEHVARWEVHGKLNFVVVAASRFADFYAETFRPADATEPYLLLQGFPTRSLDAGRGLWRLGRMLRADQHLRALFAETEIAELPAALARSAAGRAFLHAFDAYLDEFGWRNDGWELAVPTWREDPRIPLATLRGYLALGDEADPDARFAAAVERRDELLARARAALAGEPAQLARFEALYAQARAYLPVTEDHNHYIDMLGITVLRLPLLELGRRLSRRGSLARPDDIFLLYLDEIRAGMAGTDQRALAAGRAAELAHWCRVVPPASIGDPPAEEGPADPFAEGLAKLFGLPPEPSADPRVLAGIGASPGVVRGRATVVRRLEEADKLEPGDVLVCEMTLPPWTPLFSTVAAVVADTGGVLSHCAILAREYGLPCVVRTVTGTTTLADGMLLTVDGSQGIVRIERDSVQAVRNA